MKKIAFAVLSVVILAASSSVFAEGKTRAQVYQELIELERFNARRIATLR